MHQASGADLWLSCNGFSLLSFYPSAPFSSPGTLEATVNFLQRFLCSFVRRRERGEEKKKPGVRGVGRSRKEGKRGRVAEVRGKDTKSSGSVTDPESPPCFNDSDKLKRGLWEVVTLTKPLTAAILHRGCEQLPACQSLTEIIAAPTGSFGRQMVEAIPIHLPAAIPRFLLCVRPKTGRQNAAFLIIRAH